MKGMMKWSAIAAAVALTAGTAQAQQWNSIPTLSNTVHQSGSRAFWNNWSDDGLGCNIGFILTGTASTANCQNQRPTNWLPFNGPAAQQYFSLDGQAAMAFTFRAGLYDIAQLGSSTGGDVATANVNWGFFDANGQTYLPTVGGFTNQVLFTSDWGFFITLNTPTPGANVQSNDANYARHFSVLGTAGTGYSVQGGVARLDPGQNQTLYIGMEDNACLATNAPTCPNVTDYDNNDVIFSVTSVPEPSTYVLMAGGLAALAVAARRRRNA